MKTLTNKTIDLIGIDMSYKVGQIKELIQDKEGIPPDQ